MKSQQRLFFDNDSVAFKGLDIIKKKLCKYTCINNSNENNDFIHKSIEYKQHKENFADSRSNF